MSSLKRGDRFYYENSGPLSFTPEQLREIRSVTLASIMCRNTDIGKVQPRILRHAGHGNALTDCANIRNLDLSLWGGVGCVPLHGGFSEWQQTPCFGTFLLRYRICNNPTPNACGRPCHAPIEITIVQCGNGRGIIRSGGRRGRKRGRGMSPGGMVPGLAEQGEQLPDAATLQTEILRHASGDLSQVDMQLISRAIAGYTSVS